MLKLKLQYFVHLMQEACPTYISLSSANIFLLIFFYGIIVIRKEPDVGKDWRQEEKGMTEDKMVG